MGIFEELFTSDLIVFCAIGIAAAVLLHRKDKKCRVWPALPAIILWLACEIGEQNLRSYMGEFLVLVIGCFALGYAVGWLITDVVYLLKKIGKREKE